MVDLKTLRPNKPVSSIPRPYHRPKLMPETKTAKVPKKLAPPQHPLFRSPIKPINKQFVSPGAIEHIAVPLTDLQNQSADGLVKQVQSVSIPQVPIKIGAADAFDQTLSYKRAIRRRIEEHKQFPPQAIQRGLEGNVGVRFLLYRNGKIENVEVTKSSNISLLDQAAIRAIKDGNPFPIFPQSIAEDSMLIEVTLNFQLHGGF